MSTAANPGFRVRVDVTNPGQFFACCGLLEIAERIAPGTESVFEGDQFRVLSNVTLQGVLNALRAIRLSESPSKLGKAEESPGEAESESSSGDAPIEIIAPFSLQLDWWIGNPLKTWAGSMQPRAILLAMCGAIDPDSPDPLNQRTVVFDPVSEGVAGSRRGSKPKKREPFYFDARRAPNSSDLDIGFSTNRLKMETLAYPAVEALCFIGLQRSRPSASNGKFTYRTWHRPLPAILSAAACSGGYQDFTTPFDFLLHYRTKYMKAFLSSKPIKPN